MGYWFCVVWAWAMWARTGHGWSSRTTHLGSLIGFFIGKQTMFDEDKTRGVCRRKSLFARRNIVPQDGRGQGIPHPLVRQRAGRHVRHPGIGQHEHGGGGLPAPGAFSCRRRKSLKLPFPWPRRVSREEEIATRGGGGEGRDPHGVGVFLLSGRGEEERGPVSPSSRANRGLLARYPSSTEPFRGASGRSGIGRSLPALIA